MIKSMTGYGNADGSSGELGISIELRSVNNRYLDCSIRIPRVYTALEDTIKALIQKYISRGKVDVYITIDSSKSNNIEISVNEPLAEAYLTAFKTISEKYGLTSEISALNLARFPDVLTVEKKETDTDVLSHDICGILSEALDKFNDMRSVEGEKLYADITSRLDEIERLVFLVEERSPKTVAEYREKLASRMREILAGAAIDENRLLMEAAIYADKVAVDEETVRLRSHLAQFKSILSSDEPVGRKLDFLVQELNREANTIGSKGNDAEMARIVVNIKAEIEKIREQIQNIE